MFIPKFKNYFAKKCLTSSEPAASCNPLLVEGLAFDVGGC